MADINFLSNSDNGHGKNGSKKKKEKSEIKWTHPSGAKAVSHPIKMNSGVENKTGWFSFIKKEKKKPAVGADKKDAFDGFMDREKIKKSREEVLKLIKEKEEGGVKIEKVKRKKHINFLWLKGLFKRKEKGAKKIKEKKEEKKEDMLVMPILPEKIVEEKEEYPLPKKQEAPKGKAMFSHKREKEVKKEEPPAAPKPVEVNADTSAFHAKENIGGVLKKESWMDKLIKSWRAFLAKRKKVIPKKNVEISPGIIHNSVKEDAPAPVEEKVKDKDNKHKKGGENKKEEEKKEEKSKVKDVEEWKNPDILETNLIKGELTSFFNWKRGLIIFSIYVFVSCLAMAGIYEGLLLWGEKKKSEEVIILNKLEDLNDKIKPLEKEAEEIIAVQKKIALASGVLKKHIYWTNFFEFMEDNTLANVYYLGGFSGDNKGKYSFSANTEDFRTILEQVNLLRDNEYVSEVSVSGGNVNSLIIPGEDEVPELGAIIYGVDFNLELKINPDLFIK